MWKEGWANIFMMYERLSAGFLRARSHEQAHAEHELDTTTKMTAAPIACWRRSIWAMADVTGSVDAEVLEWESEVG